MNRLLFAAAILSLAFGTTAFAQTREEIVARNKAALNRFYQAQNVQLREIALDPCNAAPKFPAMIEKLKVPASEAHAGLQDHVDLFTRMADTACKNQNEQYSELELLIVAAAGRYLDACNYSPDQDYSVELKMARMNYSPESFGNGMKYAMEQPCFADFVTAKLTGKPIVITTPDTATPPPASTPNENGGPRRGAPAEEGGPRRGVRRGS